MQGRAIDPSPTPSRCGIRFFQLQAPGGSGEPPLPRAPSSWIKWQARTDKAVSDILPARIQSSPLASQRMSFGIKYYFVEIQSFWRSKEQVKVLEGFG